MPIKSREQQAALSLHRVRGLLIRQRTGLINIMRSVAAELGIAIAVGIEKALQMALRIVDGAAALVRYARDKPDTVDPRFVALLARKPARVASVAIANKIARIGWAAMARGSVFERGHAPMLAAA